jgi:hypothetical protein
MKRPLVVVFAGMALLLSLGSGLPGIASPAVHSPSLQAVLPTFVDLPAGAVETYPSSGIYKAPISQPMQAAVGAQSQKNWDEYHIAKESNLGLPLGSIYLKAQNGKYVELAIYERAAFTVFQGEPARQILSAVLSLGRIQITESEFVQLPEKTKLTFRKLPIAGEGGLVTPELETMEKVLTADMSKAADFDWTMADKMLLIDGTLAPSNSKLSVQPLQLGQPDASTGHRVPEVVAAGLNRMFGDKLLENAGLPLGPAVWVQARISGVIQPVVVQVFERMIVTYNPENDEANRVQIGLGGQIEYSGLTKAEEPPTPVATLSPTPTRGVELWPSENGAWYKIEGLDIPEMPGVYLNVPLRGGNKAIFGDQKTGPQRVWTGFLQSVAVQAPVQNNSDGTQPVLDTPEKVQEQLKRYGSMTYSIPIASGRLDDPYGGHSHIVAKQVSYDVKQGLQIYFGKYIAPETTAIAGGGTGVYTSVGAGVFIDYLPLETSARVNALSLYQMNAIVAWLNNTKDPSYDLYDVVRLSTFPDQPKPIDHTLYFEYTGPDSYETDLYVAAP